MEDLKTALAENDKTFLVGFIMSFKNPTPERYKEMFEEISANDISEIYQKASNFANSIKGLYNYNNKL